jgi:hypothetical protein
VVRRDHADRNDLLDLRDHSAAGHRHHRVEIAGGQGVDQIAVIVGHEGLHDREVGLQGQFQQKFAAIDFDLALALLDDRAHAGRRQNAPQSVAPRADLFDQGSLRDQLNLQCAGDHLLLGFGVEPDMARDHLAQGLGADKLANTAAGHRGVIGDHRQVAALLAQQLVDDHVRGADAHETADHQAGPIGDQGNRFLDQDRTHRSSPLVTSPGF